MRSETILIANPCDAERSLLGHALAHAGLDVIQAASAKEAVELAQTRGAALVVLDTLGWQTPAMNALAILKANPMTRRIPVVSLDVIRSPSCRSSQAGLPRPPPTSM